ncbi:hypothetical protein ABEB36_010737 [Hypothenemus hampei]
MWARELGLNCTPQVRIPAYPAEHFYATTGFLDEQLQESLPIVRDYDSHMYAREYNHGLMVGWFEKEAKPAFGRGEVPRDWEKHIEEDKKHIKPLWADAVNRFPILKGSKEPEIVNSPDNFTPDGRWILGEAPEVKNYFVACGMNGNSLQGAGGIGKAVSEWIIEGQPKQDLLPFILQRFLNVHNSRHYLKQRIKEVVGRHYAILYPFQCEYKYARELRCSPLYSVLKTRGAVFGIKMAYERALYFDTTYKKGHQSIEMPRGTFFKPKFFDFVKEEYLACIEGVGIIDMSSFSKIEVKSPGSEVVSYLQKICSNDIDVPIGTIVHTGMQNIRGGYENDCMLVRQSINSYFMVSPTSQQTRIYEWMKRNLSDNTSIVLNDVTSMYTVLNVVGPKSIELLSELSNTDLKVAPFSYLKVNVGYASDVMVMSFTHTGEPGYCLYIPSEYALHIYYKLMTAGRDFGIRDVGVITQRYMRLERFIPFWAEELNSFTTPFEAGNDYSVKLDKKENFIGKEALIKQSTSGVRKRLVFFHFDNIDPDVDIWPWGGEPLFRNNEFVGTVTSAGFGFAANKLICLGFITKPPKADNRIVTRDYILSKNASYEVDIAGHRFSATPYLHAPKISGYDKKEYRPTPIKYKSDISH